jgi:Uma2 family endonuclease
VVQKEKSMGAESDAIAVEIGARLKAFVKANGLGSVFGSRTGYDCFPRRPSRVLVPDVSFVSAGRMPGDRSPPGHIEYPPDLAVEVVDPVERAGEIEEKVADYRTIGVRLMWIVYPDTRTVLVRRPDRTCTELDEAGTLSGEDVLPGFACPVADLFA